MKVCITEEFWKDVAPIDADYKEEQLISTKCHAIEMNEVEFTNYLIAYVHSQRDMVYWCGDFMQIIKHIEIPQVI